MSMSVFVIVVIDESNASKVSHDQDEPTSPPTISRRDSSARRMSLGLPSSPRKSSITRGKSLGLSRESTGTRFDKVIQAIMTYTQQSDVNHRQVEHVLLLLCFLRFDDVSTGKERNSE